MSACFEETGLGRAKSLASYVGLSLSTSQPQAEPEVNWTCVLSRKGKVMEKRGDEVKA